MPRAKAHSPNKRYGNVFELLFVELKTQLKRTSRTRMQDQSSSRRSIQKQISRELSKSNRISEPICSMLEASGFLLGLNKAFLYEYLYMANKTKQVVQI